MVEGDGLAERGSIPLLKFYPFCRDFLLRVARHVGERASVSGMTALGSLCMCCIFILLQYYNIGIPMTDCIIMFSAQGLTGVEDRHVP